MKRLFLPLALLVLVVTACGDDDTTDTGADNGEVDFSGSWQLESGTVDDTPIDIADGNAITMDITTEGDVTSIAGTSGCNQYGGGVEVGADTLRISEVFSTMMACDPPEIMAAESAYLGALERVDTVTRNDDQLVLTGEGVELVFVPIEM